MAEAELSSAKIKMTTPKVKENFPDCTFAGSFLGGQKRRGCCPMISSDIPPQASAVDSTLAKSCTHLGEGLRDWSGVKKDNWTSVNKDPDLSYMCI